MQLGTIHHFLIKIKIVQCLDALIVTLLPHYKDKKDIKKQLVMDISTCLRVKYIYRGNVSNENKK